MRPRLIDLFCGAGGAGMGYHWAGCDVTGVDIVRQPRYPFEIIEMDALTFLEIGGWMDYDIIHASPPCQAYSDLRYRTNAEYPDLIGELRALIKGTELPYIIENVDSAPLVSPTLLCGTMFDQLRVIRHRLFETNWPLEAPEHFEHPPVFTYDKRKSQYGLMDQDHSFIQVTGGGNSTIQNKRAAMGITWEMTQAEVNEAIPPAYTHLIGEQLLQLIFPEMTEGTEVSSLGPL
jgi:DNA (cytosine-5)-methyltransferase 1